MCESRIPADWLILAADARWAAFVPAAHAIAVCFSAVVAVPVIVVLLGVIWAVTRSAGQMLRGMAMAALPMAVVGLIKTIVDRPRPSTARGALMPDPSFPSGHTACSVVVVSLALFALQVIDVRIKDSRGLADSCRRRTLGGVRSGRARHRRMLLRGGGRAGDCRAAWRDLGGNAQRRSDVAGNGYGCVADGGRRPYQDDC